MTKLLPFKAFFTVFIIMNFFLKEKESKIFPLQSNIIRLVKKQYAKVTFGNNNAIKNKTAGRVVGLSATGRHLTLNSLTNLQGNLR